MRRFLLAAVVAVVGLVATATPARAAAITFNSTTANVGQTFEVAVKLTNNSHDIAGFAFDFLFDTSVLRLDNVSPGDIFSGLHFFDSDVSAGVHVVSDWILPILGSGDATGVLAILTFTAIGPGGGDLALFNTELYRRGWFGAVAVNHTVQNGNIDVGGTGPTPVPEPGTMTLFGLGAYALARRIRRRNSTDAAAV